MSVFSEVILQFLSALDLFGILYLWKYNGKLLFLATHHQIQATAMSNHQKEMHAKGKLFILLALPATASYFSSGQPNSTYHY